MKGIYSITKGQLITLWIFGAVSLFYAFDASSGFYVSLILLALIFYTIGWRNNRKEKS